jgi:hypothetical protein
VRFLKSKLVVGGLVLLLAGVGPLVTVIVLAALGMTKDPDPNPIGFGLLAFVTFWPSMAMIAIGIARTRRLAPAERGPASRPSFTNAGSGLASGLSNNVIARAAAGAGGAVFIVLGLNIMLHEPPSRGRSLVLVVGVVAVVWAVLGRVPGRRR